MTNKTIKLDVLPMTPEDRKEMAAALRRQAEADFAHANALDAETADLDSQGYFDEEA